MRPGSPQTRFLLRGSAALIALLVLWWFVLFHPLLYFLRGSLEFSGNLIFGANTRDLVTETPSGDWTLRVPLEAVVASPQQPGPPTRIHSVEFDVPRSDVIAFTFSLPVFWALILAAPGIRRSLRPLLIGTILVAVLEVVLLLLFIEISAHKVAAQMVAEQDQASKYWLRFGDYMVVNVIPYAAPFVIAISLHRELRWQILRWGSAQTEPQPAKKQRKRR